MRCWAVVTPACQALSKVNSALRCLELACFAFAFFTLPRPALP